MLMALKWPKNEQQYRIQCNPIVKYLFIALYRNIVLFENEVSKWDCGFFKSFILARNNNDFHNALCKMNSTLFHKSEWFVAFMIERVRANSSIILLNAIKAKRQGMYKISRYGAIGLRNMEIYYKIVWYESIFASLGSRLDLDGDGGGANVIEW